MHITLKSKQAEYPQNLSHIPNAQKILELVEKHFKVWEVIVETDDKFGHSFSMDFHLNSDLDSFVERLHVRYLDYKTGRYTMSFSFHKHYSPFSHFYDSESYGEDAETVFYGLLNGHLEWVKRFAEAMVKSTKKMTEKVPKNKRKIVETFKARDYC